MELYDKKMTEVFIVEIINQGSLDKLKNVKTLVCKKCGCVFKANKDEYEKYYQYGQIYDGCGCKCPCCGFNTTIIIG
jgi:hypothetical protein